jgi:hypothetical protein
VLSTPKPLTTDEIRTALIYRMAEAMVRTLFKGKDPLPQELLNETVLSMDRHLTSCNMNGKAYSSFRAKWTLDVTFDNFGRKTGDHFEGVVSAGELSADTETIHLEIEKPDIPPNLERVETEQDVPVSQAGRGTAMVRYPKPAESSVKIDRRRKGFRKADLGPGEPEIGDE